MAAAVGTRALWPLEIAASYGTVTRTIALSVAGPVFLSLAFPPLDIGPIALIALVPLFILWSKQSWKQALLSGWVAGMLIFAASLYWTSLTVFNFVGVWAVLALIVLCVIQGSAVAATAVVASITGRGGLRIVSIFCLPASWLLCESVRTRGFLGVPFGELGLAAAHLPWLLPVAAFGGVYLLTAAVALANAAVAATISKSKQVRTTGFVVLVALAMGVAAANIFPESPLSSPSLKVAVVQGDIDQQVKWTPDAFVQSQAIYARLTREVASKGVKVVVWPETAIATSARQDQTVLGNLRSLVRTTHVWLLAGTLDSPTAAGYYNALLDLKPDGTIGGIYHKRLLVPFAEYLPLEQFLRRLPLMRNASAFLRGPGPHLLPAADSTWGPLICFESAFAPYARATANAGADVLVIATDDGWFAGTTEPYQHADAAALQAVATGRWVVRAASTGISEIIDPHGEVVAKLGVGRRGIITGDVGRGITTLYDRYGIAWLLALSLIAVGWGLFSGVALPLDLRRISERPVK